MPDVTYFASEVFYEDLSLAQMWGIYPGDLTISM